MLAVVLILALLAVYFFNRTSDRSIVILAALDVTIINYCNAVFSKKVKELAKQHNLNPESKMNSILSYHRKIGELTTESTIEIMKLLSSDVRNILSIYYTDKTLALIISNKLNDSLS